jgi:hypothetical protein
MVGILISLFEAEMILFQKKNRKKTEKSGQVHTQVRPNLP